LLGRGKNLTWKLEVAELFMNKFAYCSTYIYIMVPEYRDLKLYVLFNKSLTETTQYISQ
jgi:hypothetical protein